MPAKSKAQQVFAKDKAKGFSSKPGLSKEDALKFLEERDKMELPKKVHNDVRKKRRPTRADPLKDAVKGYVERTAK